MIEAKEAIKDSFRPVKSAGKIVSEAVKPTLLEKLAPLAPGESPSLKRRILEKIFGNTKK